MSEQRFPYTDGTTLNSDLSRAVHTANLEWRIVEAAVARREAEKDLFPMGFPQVDMGSDYKGGKHSELQMRFAEETTAVDALIAAREAELKEEK